MLQLTITQSTTMPITITMPAHIDVESNVIPASVGIRIEGTAALLSSTITTSVHGVRKRLDILDYIAAVGYAKSRVTLCPVCTNLLLHTFYPVSKSSYQQSA